MKYGVSMFPTHDAIDPGSLAQLAEAAGFESLFFPDHSHIPAGRQTPFPGGGELGREYSHTLDLFVALTAAAAATTELRVGSGVCLLTQRDPITCAKQTASIDHPLRTAASSSAWAPAGTPRRWPITAPTRARGSRCCRSASRRCARSGRTTRPPTTAVSSTSTASGRGPSPCRNRTRRSCSRATGRGRSTACSPTPTAGRRCPNPVSEHASRNSAAEPANAGRDVTVTVFGAALDARDLDAYAAAGVERCVFGLPLPSTACEVERVVEDGAIGDRGGWGVAPVSAGARAGSAPCSWRCGAWRAVPNRVRSCS